ncbi:erythromycin esterase family protein [Formosa sediminum]|nr:erythromycin esterase family protein [Formosa sediminum]
MFNSDLFNLEGDSLEDSDPNLMFLTDKDYLMSFDLSEFKDGKRSVRIKGLNKSATTFANLSLIIPLKIQKESELELSVWVKTDSLVGDNSGAILRLMGYKDTRSSGNALVFEFSKNILKGSEDWTKISLTTSIEDDVNIIVLSGLMQGQGCAWFDDFSLIIDGEKVQDIVFFKDQEETEEIKKALQPFVSPITNKQGKQISNYVDSIKPEAHIIGIGEATHGTKEIYNYKIETIKSLIKNNGVNTIALENYYSNSFNLNTYIQNKTGDLKEVIKDLRFWCYFTPEFEEFIIWLKDYNKNSVDKISIVGIDAQPGGNALKLLIENLKENDDFTTLLNELNSDSLAITDKVNVSKQLLEELENSNQSENILMTAKELSQSYYLEQHEGSLKYSRTRDSLMAVNIAYLDKKIMPNKKMVYWAHDSHVQKMTGWTGGFLEDIFNDKYINLGFLLGNGTFTAVDNRSRTLDSDNYLTPSQCNSLEALMDAYNFPVVLFNSNFASKDPFLKTNLFNKYIVKRDVGALETIDQFTFMGDNPADLFDLLIYIKDSTPTKILK